MRGAKVTKKAELISEGVAVNGVRFAGYSISYASFAERDVAWHRGEAPDHRLAVGGVRAAYETVRNGTYPLARSFYFITNGYPPRGPLYDIVTLPTTRRGEEIILRRGYVPLTDFAPRLGEPQPVRE